MIAFTSRVVFYTHEDGGIQQLLWSEMAPSFGYSNSLVACYVCFAKSVNLMKGKEVDAVVALAYGERLLATWGNVSGPFMLNVGGQVIGKGRITGDVEFVQTVEEAQLLAELHSEQQ